MTVKLDDLAVEKILKAFDFDEDSTLSSEEIAALVLTVNPGVRFSDDQVVTIVREMLAVAYAGTASTSADGLTLDGLKRLYSCGVADLRHDLDVLGISQSMLAAEYYERSMAVSRSARESRSDDSSTTQTPRAPQQQQQQQQQQQLQLLQQQIQLQQIQIQQQQQQAEQQARIHNLAGSIQAYLGARPQSRGASASGEGPEEDFSSPRQAPIRTLPLSPILPSPRPTAPLSPSINSKVRPHTPSHTLKDHQTGPHAPSSPSPATTAPASPIPKAHPSAAAGAAGAVSVAAPRSLDLRSSLEASASGNPYSSGSLTHRSAAVESLRSSLARVGIGSDTGAAGAAPPTPGPAAAGGLTARSRASLPARGEAALDEVRKLLLRSDRPSEEDLARLRDLALSLDDASQFEFHMEAAALLVKQHQLKKEALESGRLALELRPDSGRGLFRVGNVHFALGDFSAARACYDKALLGPDLDDEGGSELRAKIHINLGITLEVQGLLIAACEQYREAFLLSPRMCSAIKLLGSALYELGEYEAAIEALSTALVLKPDYVDAQCDLGLALFAAGQMGGARQALVRALQLDPFHVESNYNMGNLLREVGHLEKSVEHYRRVVSRDKRHWRAMMNMAAVLQLLSRTDEALLSLREANRIRGAAALDRKDELRALEKLAKEQLRRMSRASDNGAAAGPNGAAPGAPSDHSNLILPSTLTVAIGGRTDSITPLSRSGSMGGGGTPGSGPGSPRSSAGVGNVGAVGQGGTPGSGAHGGHSQRPGERLPSPARPRSRRSSAGVDIPSSAAGAVSPPAPAASASPSTPAASDLATRQRTQTDSGATPTSASQTHALLKPYLAPNSNQGGGTPSTPQPNQPSPATPGSSASGAGAAGAKATPASQPGSGPRSSSVGRRVSQQSPRPEWQSNLRANVPPRAPVGPGSKDGARSVRTSGVNEDLLPRPLPAPFDPSVLFPDADATVLRLLAPFTRCQVGPMVRLARANLGLAPDGSIARTTSSGGGAGPVPASFSGHGGPCGPGCPSPSSPHDGWVRKSAAEQLIRELLRNLEAQKFQSAMHAVNVHLFRRLSDSRGYIHLGKLFSVFACLSVCEYSDRVQAVVRLLSLGTYGGPRVPPGSKEPRTVFFSAAAEFASLLDAIFFRREGRHVETPVGCDPADPVTAEALEAMLTAHMPTLDQLPDMALRLVGKL